MILRSRIALFTVFTDSPRRRAMSACDVRAVPPRVSRQINTHTSAADDDTSRADTSMKALIGWKRSPGFATGGFDPRPRDEGAPFARG